jgi:hypothetical protein
MTRNTSNHHRYGEVKTRLTIEAGSDFGRFAGVGRSDGEGSEPCYRAGSRSKAGMPSGTWWWGCLSTV